jgi:hypothetical protein
MADETVAPSRAAGPALFAISAAACGLFAAGLIGRATDDLVGFVSDDAFYYLQTARHLASGGKPTFDGLHETNGFHPAWMAVTTLLAALFEDRETLLRAALAASFATHLAGCLLLVRLCARFVSPLWAWVLGALWAVNPLPVTMAMQGVEAPLVIAATLTVALAFTAIVARRPWTPGLEDVTRKDLVRLGAALGFVFWARTDGGVVAAATIAVLGAIAGRAALRVVGTVGLTFAACATPWFVWSYLTTGSLVQDSGAVKMLWAESSHASMSAGARLSEAWEFVTRWWLGRSASLLVGFPQIVGPVLAVVYAGAVGACFFAARRRDEAGGLRTTTVWIVVALTTTTLVYAAFFTEPMVWYCALPGLALFLVGVLWAGDALRRVAALQRPAIASGAGAAAVVAAIAVFGHYTQPMRDPARTRPMPFEYPWQRDVLTSQREFEGRVPAGAKIGCFNAGIPAYFGERTVVNLDGLVNHDLVDVYRRGEFDRWLEDEKIAFIADEPNALGRAQKLTKNPLRLTSVTTSPLRGWRPPTRFLWRVEPK